MEESSFLKVCRTISLTIAEQIQDLVGTERGGEEVRIGADQTPTELIDEVAENCAIIYLRESGIGSHLLSEEAGLVLLSGTKGTVYLDPIDGTYNAVAGIPFYALSLAYGEDGIIQEGFVKDLASGEEFYALKGGGAYLNGCKISVSTVPLLEASAMSLYGKKYDPDRAMQLGQKIRRWRLLGASALELCYVGCGRIDGFIDLRGTLRIIDAAAGMLICSEAGGIVSSLDDTPVHYPDDVTVGRCVVATNAVIHRKVIEYLR